MARHAPHFKSSYAEADSHRVARTNALAGPRFAQFSALIQADR